MANLDASVVNLAVGTSTAYSFTVSSTTPTFRSVSPSSVPGSEQRTEADHQRHQLR
jgi:hypothetical protein